MVKKKKINGFSTSRTSNWITLARKKNECVIIAVILNKILMQTEQALKKVLKFGFKKKQRGNKHTFQCGVYWTWFNKQNAYASCDT